MPIQDSDVGSVLTSYAAALDDSPGIAIKAGAGLLYGWHIKNTTAAALYVQIFDVALGDVALGTTTPKISIGIAANGTAEAQLGKPIQFGTAISAFSTTSVAGSTAAASDAMFFYA